ncbi:hypothetical protein DDV96_07810 [Marixanthomonas spongiae]|uniref:DUF6268 domain-containing protein n=2 Tax=Marixanthomonas spongiae TaxID=2174845 RepID=A0A2U0I2G5_9FLAO|nr:hypothetical protein DDV96_07810 [Marixanthomonas spongiae]
MLTSAQDYVDIFRIGYSETFNNNFKKTNSSTRVKSFEVGLTFPVVLNDIHALITGADFSTNKLQLFPQAERTNLYSTNIKLGLASTYSEKWSSTIVLLPKIASDYNGISGDDFYMGGFAVLKLQKKKNLIYRFGAYGSQEAFGLFTTPIIGWYYLSPNKKFEMDMSLPISADVSYALGKTTIGMDYFGIGRSFNIKEENESDRYVDLSSLDFAAYWQFNFLDKSVLLRTKLGYSTNDYEVYTQDDTIDLGVSAFSFGDNRNQLNPSISGGFYAKIEAIYRFNLPAEVSRTPEIK